MKYSHTVWLVSEGLNGGYLPNQVEAFESEFQARSFIQDEIEFWNENTVEPVFEPYDKSNYTFNSIDGNESFQLYPEVITSDFADISLAVEEFNDW